MKEYYLVKYCYPNYCETQIINKKSYEHIKDKIGVIYNYITFEDITGKITKINKENLNFISLEKIRENNRGGGMNGKRTSQKERERVICHIFNNN